MNDICPVFEMGRFENNVCTQIVWLTPRQLLTDELQDLVIALACKERTFVLPLDKPSQQHLFGGLQINRYARLVDDVHIVEEAGSTASQRDDDILVVSNLFERTMLDLPEARLSHFCKDVLHRLVVACLDKIVEVDKFQVHDLRERTTQCSFARSHISYQEDTLH